jgi:hypothetical protein
MCRLLLEMARDRELLLATGPRPDTRQPDVD